MERLAAISRQLAGCSAPVRSLEVERSSGSSRCSVARGSFYAPLGQRQLFLDLVDVASHAGLEHRMHRPEKYGPVLFPVEGEDSVQIRCAPAFIPNEQVYKLWLYEQQRGIGMATSADGITWTRPVLQARQHAGCANNNLVVGPCGEQVLHDPHDPDPSKRYKSFQLVGCSERVFSPTPQRWRLPLDRYLYGESPWRIEFSTLDSGSAGGRHAAGHPLEDGSRELSWCIGVTEHLDEADPLRRYSAMGRFQCRQPTVSADGIHWRLLEGADSLPSGDEANLSYDEATGEYLATIKIGEMGPYGRSIALSTSSDYSAWTPRRLMFHADELDREEADTVIERRLRDISLQRPGLIGPVGCKVDVYNMGLFRYEGVYIGLPAFFYHTGDDTDNSDGFHHVQLCSSRDLQHWERLGERQPFIEPSQRGSGFTDQSQIMPPSRPVLDLQGNLRFYYYGGRVRGHGAEQDDPGQPNGAVMMATLRRDGFMSMAATGSEHGELWTKPFPLLSPFLNLNCAAKTGLVNVEVRDATTEAVLASGVVSETDSVYTGVQWATSDLAAIQAHVGSDVQLRFRLQRAELFAWWFESQPPPEY